MKPFKSAVIVGRFQPIHIGHQKLIEIGLNISDKLVIFIGSADKCKTKRNPFDADYRMKLINKIYEKEIIAGRIIVKKLDDLTDENDLTTAWGDYVIKESIKVLNEKPECIIYGKDKNIFKCFSTKIVKGISEVFVDRQQLLISATKLRECILNDKKEEFEKYTSDKIHKEYENLRKILVEVERDDLDGESKK